MASNPLSMMPAAGAGMPAGGETDDDSQGIGSKATGYAGPENGPFSCGNCQHFDGQGSCNNPKVQADPEVSGKVEAEGCCNLFSPGSQEAAENEQPEQGAADLTQNARFPKPAAGSGGY